MTDELNRKRHEDDFESLFESFERGAGRVTPDEPAASTSSRAEKMSQTFRPVKARRKAAQERKKSSQAPAPEEDETPSFLDTPLDLDAARQEFLAATEPEVGETRPKRQKKRGKNFLGLQPRQQLVLGVLGALVVVVYLAMGITLWRVLSGNGVVPEATLVASVPEAPGGSEGAEALPPPTSTPESSREVGAPTLPPPTPTPRTVVTRLDLQVLQYPNDVQLRLERGAEYIERFHDYEAAVRDYARVLELEPEHPAAYAGLGRAYFYLRRWNEAEEALLTSISFDADQPSPHFWLGELYYYAGRHEEALDQYQWATELAPTDAEYFSWLARAAVKSEELEVAAFAVTEAISLDERLPLAYIARGEMRLLEGDIEEAQGDFLHALNLAPYNFWARLRLADFYAAHVPERLVDAERLVRQAQQDQTLWVMDRARALQVLARVYVEQGRREEARQLLAEASDLAKVDGRPMLPGLDEDMGRLLSP